MEVKIRIYKLYHKNDRENFYIGKTTDDLGQRLKNIKHYIIGINKGIQKFVKHFKTEYCKNGQSKEYLDGLIIELLNELSSNEFTKKQINDQLNQYITELQPTLQGREPYNFSQKQSSSQHCIQSQGDQLTNYKIYKLYHISCPEQFYIGSTDEEIQTRLQKHINDINCRQKQSKFYLHFKQFEDKHNIKIELVEDLGEISKQEAEKREGELTVELNAHLNTKINYGLKRNTDIQNDETEYKEYTKQLYEKRKEHGKLQEYYDKPEVKEQIKSVKQQYYQEVTKKKLQTDEKFKEKTNEQRKKYRNSEKGKQTEKQQRQRYTENGGRKEQTKRYWENNKERLQQKMECQICHSVITNKLLNLSSYHNNTANHMYFVENPIEANLEYWSMKRDMDFNKPKLTQSFNCPYCEKSVVFKSAKRHYESKDCMNAKHQLLNDKTEEQKKELIEKVKQEALDKPSSSKI